MRKGFYFMPLIILALILIVIFGGLAGMILTIPIFRVLFQFYIVITIFSFIRSVLGQGTITYVLTALLAYIFAFRLLPLTTGVWGIYIIGAYMLSGLIVFGLQPIWMNPKYMKPKGS